MPPPVSLCAGVAWDAVALGSCAPLQGPCTFFSVGIVGVCFLQAKQLVSRAVSQNICQYRSLQYSRPEGPDGALPEDLLFGANWALRPPGDGGGWAAFSHFPSLSLLLALLGNLDLLPPPGKSGKPGTTPVEHNGLVSHNGSLINVGNLLQRAEQQDSGRLYLENKIHTLELKLGEWPVAWGHEAGGLHPRLQAARHLLPS